MESYYQKHNKTAPVWSVVNADARRCEVPDDATIFYFANPFDATILSIVLDNILASIGISPRTCYIVYANPIHEHLLKDRAFVKLRLRMSTTDYVIYRTAEI